MLNEPETSLHPDLLPAVARLIQQYASREQIFVVTHARPLIASLELANQCMHHQLIKALGATELTRVDPFDLPEWKWPPR